MRRALLRCTSWTARKHYTSSPAGALSPQRLVADKPCRTRIHTARPLPRPRCAAAGQRHVQPADARTKHQRAPPPRARLSSVAAVIHATRPLPHARPHRCAGRTTWPGCHTSSPQLIRHGNAHPRSSRSRGAPARRRSHVPTLLSTALMPILRRCREPDYSTPTLHQSAPAESSHHSVTPGCWTTPTPPLRGPARGAAREGRASHTGLPCRSPANPRARHRGAPARRVQSYFLWWESESSKPGRGLEWVSSVSSAKMGREEKERWGQKGGWR